MAILNSIANWLSADGIPAVYSNKINTNGNAAVVIPTAGTFTPVKPRAGYLRVKSSIVGTNATIKVGAIQVTDGTNTTNLSAGEAVATSNGVFYDVTTFFWLDYGISNVTIANIVVANNNCTFDVEVAGMQ